MTADEIRRAEFTCDDGAWESALWLKQIAAQLAEMNEKRQSEYAALEATMKELASQLDLISQQVTEIKALP